MVTNNFPSSLPVLFYTGGATAYTKLYAPCVESFTNVPSDLFVLEEDVGSCAAGLYLKNGVSSYRLIIPANDLSDLVVNGGTVSVYYSLTATVTPDVNAVVYRDGYPVATSGLIPGNSIWATVLVSNPAGDQYVLPVASTTMLGGVRISSDFSMNSSGVMSLAAQYLTTDTASNTYLSISNASSTYLTKADASVTYLSIANAATEYLALNTGGTVHGTVTAVSLQSFSGQSSMTDAGLSTPVVVTQVANISNSLVVQGTSTLAGVSTTSLTVNGNLVWDAGNFNPNNYLLVSGGTITGGLTVNSTLTAVGSIVSQAGLVKANAFATNGGGMQLGDSLLTIAAVATQTITAPNSTLAATISSTGQLALAQRPTFNGNLAWDVGNLPSPLSTTTAASTYLPISNGVVNGALGYNAAGSVFRGVLLNWSGVSLWKIGSDSAQTGSSNGGGDLNFYAYADNGSFLGSAATVTRATRTWNFPNSPTVPTTATTDNSTNAASTAMVQAVAATRAPVNLTGSPHYIYLPYVTNAQINTAGTTKPIIGIIFPRSMTFTSNFAPSQGYTDVTPDGSPIFNINVNGAGVGTMTVLHGFNKVNFSVTGGGTLTVSAGDRMDIILLSGLNTTGAMDGIRICLVATLN